MVVNLNETRNSVIRLAGIPLVNLSFVELAEFYKDCSIAKNKTEIIAVERELQRREEIYLKNNWSY